MNESTSQFLSLFNDLEQALKNLLQEHSESPRSFKSMVAIASKRSAYLRDKSQALYDLADLRNFLVHEYGNRVYATPTDDAIQVLENILGMLHADRKLLHLCSGAPVVIDSNATLTNCLKLMHKHEFSRLPVYGDGLYLGLLSGNIIARWFAANLFAENGVCPDSNRVRVTDLLKYAHDSDEAVLLPQNMTVVDFYNVLRERPSRSGVYLITPKGLGNERPLGIITYYDIPKILSELE